MSNVLQFFRANPGAMVITTLLAMGAFVFGLVGFSMLRAGASLRPIVFIAGLFAIVVVPQALLHYSQALGWIPKQNLVWMPSGDNAASAWQAREELLAVKDGRFTQPQALYGESFDPDLLNDLRTRLAMTFGTSQAAEMAVLRTGSSVTLAQFSTDAEAQAAAVSYAAAMLGAVPGVGIDGTRTITRATDVVKLLVAGRTLVAYAAPDSASANRAVAASPIVSRASTPTASSPAEKKFWLYRLSTLVPLLLLLVFCAVLWFFRMAMWASEVPAAKDVEPSAPATLRERLMSVNKLDVPFTVAASPDDASLLIVTWRYADAKWLDQARAHGLRRTHRMLMRIDEKDATVRPTEQLSMMDWDAGRDGGSVRWATQRGIVFFQYHQERVFGLQLDSNNRFTPNLSYAYKFNLQEMKAPFIEAVTQSGWKWRPTIMHGPRWLSWLTQ